jgi:hypothetical protein
MWDFVLTEGMLALRGTSPALDLRTAPRNALFPTPWAPTTTSFMATALVCFEILVFALTLTELFVGELSGSGRFFILVNREDSDTKCCFCMLDERTDDGVDTLLS